MAKALRLVGLVAAACALGCAGERASSATADQLERLPETTGSCFFKNTVTSWRVLDDRRIQVDSHPPYEIEFYSRCHGIRSIESIGFSSRDGQVCDYRNDAVVGRDVYCPIASIHSPKDQVIEQQDTELDAYEREQNKQQR